MSVLICRSFIGWALLFLFPLFVFAADTGPSAMLHSQSGVWVNGKEVPDSTAIFSGDSLETKTGSVANLDVEGSTVLIRPETVVTFNGDSLTLEHGGVDVTTSSSLRVHVNCIRVVPVSSAWTQYQVSDLSGTVHVAAIKSDVNITRSGGLKKPTPENATQSATVQEGHQVDRNESDACGAAEQPQSPEHPLNTRALEIGGGLAGTGIIICAVFCRGSSPPSVSPWQP
jgi:hypothetical protein